MSDIRVLILGTGGMANAHAEAYAAMDGVKLVAGVDRDPARLHAFNAKFGIVHAFDDIQAALDWGQFDVVSNVTPDGVHHITTLPLLRAGKHVLCEKPLAMSYADAAEMADLAQQTGVINMVNLTYRNVPAVMEAAQLVADGLIGEVRHFEASYLQSWLVQPAWGDWKTQQQWLWRLSSAHGSLGVLGDVGVHILDFATLVAGAMTARVSARLTTFHKAPNDQIGDYVLDANDSMTMQLRLQNGAVGVIHASRMAAGHLNDLRLRIFGTQGGIEARFENNQSILRVCTAPELETAAWHDMPVPPVATNYRRFIDAVRTGTPVQPDFRRGAALQKTLDAALASDKTGCADIAL